MVPDEVFDSIDKLIELETRKIELLRQLKRGYILANIIGRHPNQIKGTLSYGIHHHGAPLYARPWRTQELVVRLDGEEVACKRLIDVPLDLWPRDVRDEFERQQKRNVRRAHA